MNSHRRKTKKVKRIIIRPKKEIKKSTKAYKNVQYQTILYQCVIKGQCLRLEELLFKKSIDLEIE
eukprot:CAMPEP_0168331104 /NCGR_PEP_ID=MMETSP0213-20121227/8135_1 /TAXON_ID=151035 /ORGANISM="Euplotes harpa, Strain FSP1.4" /LENGTH=64 /DNA_ID=CAMNT_0008334817 /DNA_START=273 /DNA_END=467 /DNA_ORIENTATION=-